MTSPFHQGLGGSAKSCGVILVTARSAAHVVLPALFAMRSVAMAQARRTTRVEEEARERLDEQCD